MFTIDHFLSWTNPFFPFYPFSVGTGNCLCLRLVTINCMCFSRYEWMLPEPRAKEKDVCISLVAKAYQPGKTELQWIKGNTKTKSITNQIKIKTKVVTWLLSATLKGKPPCISLVKACHVTLLKRKDLYLYFHSSFLPNPSTFCGPFSQVVSIHLNKLNGISSALPIESKIVVSPNSSILYSPSD